tara:strand:+ start:247 stop:492 length:246 start_codon:yes stop_codon:yes gene_type:complete
MALDLSRKETKNMSLEKSTPKGDSLTEFPTYLKHWEEARPWGWEIRILTEDGLHIFHCKWKDYRRSGLLKEEKEPALKGYN